MICMGGWQSFVWELRSDFWRVCLCVWTAVVMGADGGSELYGRVAVNCMERGTRRAPKIWVLKVALVAFAAAVLTVVRPGLDTVTDSSCLQVHFASLRDAATAAVLSRSGQWNDAGSSPDSWRTFGDQLFEAFPSRPAVAWSLTVGAISRVESQVSVRVNRPWLPIALLTGKSPCICLLRAVHCKPNAHVAQVLRYLAPMHRRTVPTRPAA